MSRRISRVGGWREEGVREEGRGTGRSARAEEKEELERSARRHWSAEFLGFFVYKVN